MLHRHCRSLLAFAHLALLFALFVASCKKEGHTPPKLAPERAELNLAYGSHPYQKVDVLFPAGYTKATPVVFLVHGGGFVAGLKEDFEEQAKLFRKNGFITVNISHRLVDTAGLMQEPPVHAESDVKIADQLADIHAAVNLYRSRTGEWGTQDIRMFVAGHSAGAILAMLYAFGDYNSDKHIKAVGNWAGATDLSIPHDSLLAGMDPRWIEAMYRAVGHMPSTANNLYFMAVSPYWVAYNSGGADLISIYPQFNTTVNMPGEAEYGLTQTQALHDLVSQHDHRQQLNVDTGSNHGFTNQAGAWERVIRQTADFFNEK